VLQFPKQWSWRGSSRAAFRAARVDVTLGAGAPDVDAQGQRPDHRRPRLAGQAVGKPIGLLVHEELDIDLNVDDADLPELVRELGGQLPDGAAGRFSLHVLISMPLKKLGDPNSLHAAGTFFSPALTVGPLRLEKLQTGLVVDKGELKLADFQAQASGGILTGTATMRLDDQRGFAATLALHHADLKQLPVDFPLQAGPTLPPTLKGTLSPWHLQAGGAARLESVQLQKFPLNVVQFSWSTSGQRLHAGDLQATGPAGNSAAISTSRSIRSRKAISICKCNSWI